jgi:hypothetical protein
MALLQLSSLQAEPTLSKLHFHNPAYQIAPAFWTPVRSAIPRHKTISHTAQSHDSVQLDRFGDSLKLMTAPLFHHEQAGYQRINGRRTITMSGSAADCTRAAMLAVSPKTSDSPPLPLPMTTVPLSMPTRTDNAIPYLFALLGIVEGIDPLPQMDG